MPTFFSRIEPTPVAVNDIWINHDTHRRMVWTGTYWVTSIQSKPPSGKRKVVNIYYDPDIQKLVVVRGIGDN